MNPPPKAGAARATWELVIADMRERDDLGRRKYGLRHQADNGRDHLQDAYEEALDFACYLRAEIEKRRLDPSYSEVVELRRELVTIRHALGEHREHEPLSDLVQHIVHLRTLVRK